MVRMGARLPAEPPITTKSRVQPPAPGCVASATSMPVFRAQWQVASSRSNATLRARKVAKMPEELGSAIELDANEMHSSAQARREPVAWVYLRDTVERSLLDDRSAARQMSQYDEAPRGHLDLEGAIVDFNLALIGHAAAAI